jgi:hypothetical protein
MARDHLAIPSTSAALECVFSSSSDLISKKRARLSRDNIKRLMCMRNWGVLKEAIELEGEGQS